MRRIVRIRADHPPGSNARILAERECRKQWLQPAVPAIAAKGPIGKPPPSKAYLVGRLYAFLQKLAATGHDIPAALELAEILRARPANVFEAFADLHVLGHTQQRVCPAGKWRIVRIVDGGAVLRAGLCRMG